MSDAIIISIQELFKKFSQDGLANYPSENVALLVQKINSVAEQLEEVPELTRDIPLLILTGFTKCSVPECFGLKNERVIKLENDGDRHNNRK